MTGNYKKICVNLLWIQTRDTVIARPPRCRRPKQSLTFARKIPNGIQTNMFSPADLCPGILKRNCAVEDKIVFGGVGIDAEIANTLELEFIGGSCRS